MPIVNTKEMLQKAYKEKYAVGAFNICNMETIQGISCAAEDLYSPLILQASPGAIQYAGVDYLVNLVQVTADKTPLPIALHLDHGSDFEICKKCIDKGFSSVMIDGSSLDYEENVSMTKKVVDYAHSRNVTVEGELGILAGVEDNVKVSDAEASYTDPAQAEDFVRKTGVDSLAVAIGTSHGAYKFKPGQIPKLRFDILEKIEERLPDFPIVLHGASSVSVESVDTINKHGGDIPNAIGIPEDMLRKAVQMSVCKINIDSDLRLAVTGQIRKYLDENPAKFDPRKYLSYARDAVYDVVFKKITTVLGSAQKA
ncbi:MAG: class II fructose-1,6-bisphosphate aldolase [Clostridia bacterium]|nr:class II fructose-1,6-bisphosphate aldolase [Clostridia bacterium]